MVNVNAVCMKCGVVCGTVAIRDDGIIMMVCEYCVV